MIYAFWVKGFEAVEAITPIDLMRRAGIEVTTVSLEERKHIENSSKVIYKADVMFDDCNFADLEGIFLAGGPGTSGYLGHEKLLDLIKLAYSQGKLISAICAAPMVLSQAEINHEMTIYPTLTNEVLNYKNAAVVTDKNVITGEAVAASVDFSLELIKYLKGEEKMAEIAKSICKR